MAEEPPQTVPSATGSRQHLPDSKEKYRAWRHWESIWSWANILIGGSSALLGGLVAANMKTPPFLPFECAVAASIAAPVLTFLLTTLKPQAKATSFEAASRELEKAISRYEKDPSKDDIFLADAEDRGIDLLNKLGSA
jgi:hypothetical protein